jgi:protein-tyrosine kinase
MLIPKASHLVERVAERLLRSGALDDSAAHLLRHSDAEQAADTSAEGAADRAPGRPVARPAAPREGPRQSSSLFAPSPDADAMKAATSAEPGCAQPSSLAGGSEDCDLSLEAIDALASSIDRGPPSMPAAAASQVVLPLSPATGQQAELPGQAAIRPGVPERAMDPAAALQCPLSIDITSLERAGMVDWSRTRTRISEEFRLVQRQIIRSAFGNGAEPGFSNLLLVTSARPGEGKSFLSTNLAGSIARQGDHHVLLVDADSKRDSICFGLGLTQASGLLDLVANPRLDPSPMIVRTPIERLSILPVGRERERSAELFSTHEMTRLIQSLGRRYADRLLILDAPPCLSTSDPAVLAQVVGQILFVVEANRTQREEIEASLDLIQSCPTITMVLNKQQVSSRYTFGAYSSYYSS